MDDRIWRPVNDEDAGNRPVTPYEHWYYRTDAAFVRRRSCDDTPLELLDVACRIDTVIEQFMCAPSAKIPYAAGFPGGIEVPDNDVPFDFVQTDYDVVVGVIDIDIPLGQRAYRHADGTTRVLAHWAMGYGPDGQTYGTKFTQRAINDLLKKHSVDADLDKPLDEDGFNREIGALDFATLSGARALARRHSHGAHMLDVAGGADAYLDPEFAGNVGLVSVAMPSRREFGEGGEFLDQHMINAVFWAHETLTAFNADNGDRPDVPMVSCLAFGRQAGAKRADTDLLSRFLTGLADLRGPDAAPFDLVIPTGNDNQSKVVARYDLPPRSTIFVDWRIKPGDQTDNYLEIWAEKSDENATPDDHLAVHLIRPGDPAKTVAMVGVSGHFHDIYKDPEGKIAARIYRFPKPPSTGGDGRIDNGTTGFLMALGPTDPRGESLGAAPSGVWTVQLENTSDARIIVHLSVQTDQSVQVVGQFVGRSYLDDGGYEDFDGQGRGLNSVAHSEDDGWTVTEDDWGTRRHGTMNVAASQKLTAVVSGYRASDGLPASYASSGLGKGSLSGREGPTVSLPVDDTPVLGGTLAAGSTDGSRVAMRGTSFAASKATRVVAERWLHHPQERRTPAKTILASAARDFEDLQEVYGARYDATSGTDDAAYAQFGEGRVPFKGKVRCHRS